MGQFQTRAAGDERPPQFDSETFLVRTCRRVGSAST